MNTTQIAYPAWQKAIRQAEDQLEARISQQLEQERQEKELRVKEQGENLGKALKYLDIDAQPDRNYYELDNISFALVSFQEQGESVYIKLQVAYVIPPEYQDVEFEYVHLRRELNWGWKRIDGDWEIELANVAYTIDAITDSFEFQVRAMETLENQPPQVAPEPELFQMITETSPLHFEDEMRKALRAGWKPVHFSTHYDNMDDRNWHTCYLTRDEQPKAQE